ncbi:hypothetical protein [Marinitoga aeolica]|uniref:Uncharacterized protein n=1 Tax=Marinitoga aeolica TaxID=2809031 RepID=A0ABY8PNZ2_9BACT|nr:hypothetical protein [Marinitoga aeolica]WGS64353.1 hypothetical protein JRV97_08225 [Marinitoga aeolica]
MSKSGKEILRRANITTILVTHDRNDALALADRIIIIENGKIKFTGLPEEIYT